MKNISFLSLMILLICYVGCKEQNEGFTIKSYLKGFSENSQIIVSDASTGKVLDSTKLINDKFISNGFIPNPPINIGITINSENNETSHTFLFIGNENIEISGAKSDFPDALKIKGSEFQKFKTALDDKLGSLNKERGEKLQTMFALRQEGKWNDSLQKAYWSKKSGIITKIDNKTNEVTKDFIEEKINSDYALSQLVTYKTEFSKDFIKKQLRKLNSNFQNSEYAKVLRTYLDNETLNKGDKFYDFKAENQNGEEVNFSTFFQKEKFVLLEFYSPYCSWCIKALPEIKKLSNQQSESLEIVTINVDKNKKDWLKKYKSNGITWSSLYDENGRYSDVYTKYRVFATPTYYLFDKNGKVIEKWDGYTDNLINEISELLLLPKKSDLSKV